MVHDYVLKVDANHPDPYYSKDYVGAPYFPFWWMQIRLNDVTQYGLKMDVIPQITVSGEVVMIE